MNLSGLILIHRSTFAVKPLIRQLEDNDTTMLVRAGMSELEAYRVLQEYIELKKSVLGI